jgi:hypothetical protein
MLTLIDLPGGHLQVMFAAMLASVARQTTASGDLVIRRQA